ncbi:MAG: sucrose-phosphate phosphatase [Sulfobacillus acidophilus]|uniref:Sucrose-phosphate phosphatase n=1 Tax=Sulfobacillus acidophilus TaxID=53633 RepID=A0A2T2WHY7_9FIRM|nr:MAG: sucrose-phosphate phosphatase [Sulfobacillus acidophilus]
MAGIKWVLASDIDGTLVGHGGENELASFLKGRLDVGVVYLTGRTRANAEALIRQYDFPAPLALATDIGADVFWGPDMQIDDAWAFQQRRDWAPRRIMRALEDMEGVSFQSRSSHWRLAFGVRDCAALTEVKTRLVHEQIACRTLWDDDARRLDIVPRGALKGRALKHILTRLNMRAQQCFVAGDAENDGDLLEGRYRGVLVANGSIFLRERLPATILRSPFEGALGVLDGLRQFLDEPSLLEREYAG